MGSRLSGKVVRIILDRRLRCIGIVLTPALFSAGRRRESMGRVVHLDVLYWEEELDVP